MHSVVDVVVIGSGCGGMAAAISARYGGATVALLEKSECFGGTTARSGGVLWVPGNPLSEALGISDSLEEAQAYLRSEAGQAFDGERVTAFLRHAPRAVAFFQKHTAVQFVAVPGFSDYHPDAPGAKPGGRSIVAAPLDGRILGKRLTQLRPPLREITFVGMMFNASEELAHFFKATRSLRSASYVARRLVCHGWEMLRYGRAVRLTNGNALAARMSLEAEKLGVDLKLSANVRTLLVDGQRVTGVVYTDADGCYQEILARNGVVLATGGFPNDISRRSQMFPHAPSGHEHLSPAPASNSGDGLRMASDVGAHLDSHLPNAAAWIPVSKVVHADGHEGVFPHLIDRYKPGIIIVNRDGNRFVNEANSYHDVGIAMQQNCASETGAVEAFLICDHRALRRYGMGFVKPFPVPYRKHLRSGYIVRGKTLADLAQRAGICAIGLERTLHAYNAGAVNGEDLQYGRGRTTYNRYLGDPENFPNPCVAPIDQGPFYAIRIVLGDLGTFSGIRTDKYGRALDRDGCQIPGLYAVGNDSTSIMGGNYPGGGITLGPALTFGFLAGEHLAQSTRPSAGGVCSAQADEITKESWSCNDA